MTGVITDTLRAVVYKEASEYSGIVCIIPALTSVTIFPNESTESYYKIKTENGFDGYCRKKNISIRY